MKNVLVMIVSVMVIFALSSEASAQFSGSAEEFFQKADEDFERSRREFNEERKKYFGSKLDLGGTYALAPNTAEDGHNNLFGFEIAAGIYVQAPGFFRAEYDIAFYNGVFGNQHISRFGLFRYGLGGCYDGDLFDSGFVVNFSPFTMSATSNGVSWAPGMGLKLFAGIFYVRPEFVVYVGEKMGVGFTTNAGLAF